MFILSNHTIGARNTERTWKTERFHIQDSDCLNERRGECTGIRRIKSWSTICQLCDLGMPRFPSCLRAFAYAVPSMCKALLLVCTAVPSGFCFNITSSERPSLPPHPCRPGHFLAYFFSLHGTSVLVFVFWFCMCLTLWFRKSSLSN